MPLFENKVLLITGGTGSFGHAVLDRFLTTDIREIRILSRDEKKQDDMRHAYQLACPACAEKIKFYIGDVRDYRSIAPAFRGVDYVFHAAALKQVNYQGAIVMEPFVLMGGTIPYDIKVWRDLSSGAGEAGLDEMAGRACRFLKELTA